MKKQTSIAWVLAACIAAAAAQPALAQGADEKKALAERIVKAQQALELDRMAQGMAQQSVGGLVHETGAVLERQVPQANREAARKQLNDALEGYVKDASDTIKSKAPGALSASLVPVYVEKFSQDELKQLAAFFESDVSKKYQHLAPDLGQAMVRAIVKETEGQIKPKITALSKKVEDILAKNGAKKAAASDKPAANAAPGTSPKNPLKPQATTPEGAPVPRPGASK